MSHKKNTTLSMDLECGDRDEDEGDEEGDIIFVERPERPERTKDEETGGFEEISMEREEKEREEKRKSKAKGTQLFRNPMVDHVRTFRDMFVDDATGTRIRDRVIKGEGLGKNQAKNFRNVAWKIFLGLLDPSDPEGWKEVMEKKRREYEIYRREYSSDERHNTDLGLEVNNPLSQVILILILIFDFFIFSIIRGANRL